jgi:hypothetical protein
MYLSLGKIASGERKFRLFSWDRMFQVAALRYRSTGKHLAQYFSYLRIVFTGLVAHYYHQLVHTLHCKPAR